ncbi:MAG: hypothetical protein SCALA702_20330 [Melioribacteraceae bacterium]|nr:MAG: hypothetical protein SCALA702_20330 [Melioribacteraceae bacterium]
MNNFEELKELGLSLVSEGRNEDAINIFEQALATQPGNFDVHNFLGILYYKQDDLNKSAANFIEAYKADQDNRDLVTNLLNVLIKLEMNDKALMIAEQFSRKNPADREMAQIYEELRKKGINKVSFPKEKNPDGLNILFLQNSPCIRNYKYATALRKKGHNVSLAYTDIMLSQRYKNLDDDTYNENIKIDNYPKLWDISKNYDIIHSHNEPDLYTVAALGGDVPVVHDTHDLISLRDTDPNLKYFEGLANRAAHGRVYSTPYQRDEAKSLYNVKGDSLVFYNYASEEHLPKKFLPKLSEQDGKIHFVYEGGIYVTNGRHRDFGDQFVELAKRGICVHIYPDNFFPDVAEYFAPYDNVYYNHPIPPHELIETMTQFDFGIIPWNLQKGNVRFLSSTIANKLFEYMAAGLPVATAHITSYINYFRENPTGVTFESIDDLVSKLPKLQEIKRSVDFSKEIYTYEREIDKVVDFYKMLIEKHKSGEKKNFHVSNDNMNEMPKEPFSIEKSFEALEGWIELNGWDGYDPYDIQDYFIQMEKAGNPLSEQDKQIFMQRNETEPMRLREELGIPKRRNPKALGLLISSKATLFKVTNNEDYLYEAEEIADWLLRNPAEGYENLCWGYPFDWQSKVFIPKGTPSVIATTAVGDGLWELFAITKEPKYIEACISICEFILNDLNRDDMGSDGICFSYTPLDNFHVHNANLFAAEFLSRIGTEIENKEYIRFAERAIEYAISEQNPEGNIFYWGKVQQEWGLYNDHYHTGFEIRCLYNAYHQLGHSAIKQAYEKYLEFYKRSFIQEDGRPAHFPIAYNNPNVNIHGAAESILLMSTLSPEYEELFPQIRKNFEWIITHMQTPEGWFGYSWNEDKKVFAPYLRWGQAWMFRAFAEYFKLLKIKSGEWGYYRKYNDTPGVKADPEQRDYEVKLNELRYMSKKYAEINNGEVPQFVINDTAKLLEVDKEDTKVNATLKESSVAKNGEKWVNTLKELEHSQNKSYKNYQIVMPDQGGLQYGSKEWTENLFRQAETDPWGQDWRASQQIRYIKAFELVSRYVKAADVKSMLDIGCCLGDFTMMLANHLNHASVTGVDISSEAVKKCSSRYPDAKFVNSALPELKELGNEKYDFVSALEVIYYVDHNRLNEALDTIYNKLNSGGYLLISSYMNKAPFFTPDKFEQFVSQKFDIVNIVLRHHLDYYTIEQPLRDVMNSIYGLSSIRDWRAAQQLENFLQSAFELLGSNEFIDEVNEISENNGGDKSISHTIILARKV